MNNQVSRQIISLLITAALLSNTIPFSAFSYEAKTIVVRQTEYFEDGGWEETTICCHSSENSSEKSSGSLTASKEQRRYSNDNTLQWTIILSGNFTYNGSSCSCTAASTSITIYDSSWSKRSESTIHSGNTASTTVTMGLRVLGATIPYGPFNLSLSCDKDGTLS